jgi:hypothetical protein
MTMFDSLWLLFALPAFGALMILFAGRWLSQKVVGWLASAAVLGSFAGGGDTLLQRCWPARRRTQYHHHLVGMDDDR